MAAASSQRNFLSPTCRVSKVGGRSSDGYGSWYMCTEGLGPGSGVLSVGIGGDISFDLALVRRFGASVRCFDPTISEADFEQLLGNASATAEERARVRFYPFGLAARNSVIPFYRSTNPIVHSLVSEPGLRGYAPAVYLRAPTLRLPQLLSVAGLERVDVLKADIEGAEWSVFNRSDVEMRRWLATSRVSQLMLEFHDRFGGGGAQRRVVSFLQSCGFTKRHEKRREDTLFVRTRAPTSECWSSR